MRQSMLAAFTSAAAALAGLMFGAQAVMGLVQPQATPAASPWDYLLEAAFAAALALSLVGLAGLNVRQEARYGRLGKLGFYAAFIGQTALLVSALGYIATGKETLGPLFPIGLLSAFVGTLAMGIATLRTGALPRWSGVLLIAFWPVVLAFGDNGGGMLAGLIWMALGYVLRSGGKVVLTASAATGSQAMSTCPVPG